MQGLIDTLHLTVPEAPFERRLTLHRAIALLEREQRALERHLNTLQRPSDALTLYEQAEALEGLSDAMLTVLLIQESI